MVCDESNARPIEGRATFATDRFRLATAATTINAVSTRPERAGASVFAASTAIPSNVAGAGRTHIVL
ncbi:hypothetical protein GCM10010168_29180 [Actinoplanes ianthinogenes]|uniref:Uncharacterized protein n=1 Tax=Actinoplanes ianthinogenes TaxID=122358 RepID=A0ABM7LLC3_9ACTN|nr:hypothetical protein Aiant_07170 [Actinoplanes ianthinogenes]GGR10003.1 hypothetical protein GCM10010168_29180 [Actinoplanes ianthinogenes]